MKIHFSSLRYQNWAQEGHQKHWICDASSLVWFPYINESPEHAFVLLLEDRLGDLPSLGVQTHYDRLNAIADRSKLFYIMRALRITSVVLLALFVYLVSIME